MDTKNMKAASPLSVIAFVLALPAIAAFVWAAITIVSMIKDMSVLRHPSLAGLVIFFFCASVCVVVSLIIGAVNTFCNEDRVGTNA